MAWDMSDLSSFSVTGPMGDSHSQLVMESMVLNQAVRDSEEAELVLHRPYAPR